MANSPLPASNIGYRTSEAVSEREALSRAEEGWPPSTSARWLIYNNLVRAKPVGSIAQRTEFGSGILILILREQRDGGTGHNAWWVSVVPPPQTISTTLSRVECRWP